ncbi:hypothetical protein HJG60_010402 [Phyllostomus discolor]|uniref:Uncharacterized protein n=1 Tax=Phyllostomus discolor TaxID=89673 RepID=A0A834B1V3_9CHIR|nr:hypothetical protein HJG60_010402 [Phyllostomus discolor]
MALGHRGGCTGSSLGPRPAPASAGSPSARSPGRPSGLECASVSPFSTLGRHCVTRGSQDPLLGAQCKRGWGFLGVQPGRVQPSLPWRPWSLLVGGWWLVVGGWCLVAGRCREFGGGGGGGGCFLFCFEPRHLHAHTAHTRSPGGALAEPRVGEGSCDFTLHPPCPTEFQPLLPLCLRLGPSPVSNSHQVSSQMGLGNETVRSCPLSSGLPPPSPPTPTPASGPLPLVAKRKAVQGPQHPVPGHPQLWQAAGFTCWAPPPSTCPDLGEGAATSCPAHGRPVGLAPTTSRNGALTGETCSAPRRCRCRRLPPGGPQSCGAGGGPGPVVRRAGWGLPRASVLRPRRAEGTRLLLAGSSFIPSQTPCRAASGTHAALAGCRAEPRNSRRHRGHYQRRTQFSPRPRLAEREPDIPPPGTE